MGQITVAILPVGSSAEGFGSVDRSVARYQVHVHSRPDKAPGRAKIIRRFDLVSRNVVQDSLKDCSTTARLGMSRIFDSLNAILARQILDTVINPLDSQRQRAPVEGALRKITPASTALIPRLMTETCRLLQIWQGLTLKLSIISRKVHTLHRPTSIP